MLPLPPLVVFKFDLKDGFVVDDDHTIRSIDLVTVLRLVDNQLFYTFIPLHHHIEQIERSIIIC